jgi:hypothetical protein
MFELSRTTPAPTLSDLYPRHGVRIARLEKMQRFMSQCLDSKRWL